MVKPERRTRGDVVATIAIAVVVAVTAALVWWTSDARATISRPAASPVPTLITAKAVPSALRQLWTAASPKTTAPLVVAASVVTGDGHSVEGRDPATGNTQWSYSRDLDLCGVSWIYQYAVAVYPDVRGCGQVTAIDMGTGRRGSTRSGYADDHVELSSDGTTVLAAGKTRLEMWRSDMVRVLGYGEVDARVKPNQVGVGKGCAMLSAAASSAAVSVLQSCPGEADVRLTLLRPGKDDDDPDLRDVPQQRVSPSSGARVLAVSDTTTAVYLPTPTPRVSVVDEAGTELSSTPVPEPPSSAGVTTQGTVSRAGDLITWWTGNSVMVFAADKLAYKYTIPASGPVVPLGPGTMMAAKLLVPVTGGLGVYDSGTGAPERVIAFARPAMDSGVA